jgi:hypothetical protein
MQKSIYPRPHSCSHETLGHLSQPDEVSTGAHVDAHKEQARLCSFQSTQHHAGSQPAAGSPYEEAKWTLQALWHKGANEFWWELGNRRKANFHSFLIDGIQNTVGFFFCNKGLLIRKTNPFGGYHWFNWSYKLVFLIVKTGWTWSPADLHLSWDFMYFIFENVFSHTNANISLKLN